MAGLKFIRPSEDKKKKCFDSNSLGRSQSKFQHNVAFTLTGKDSAIPEDAAPDQAASPVFTTSLNCDLFVSMCTKSKVDWEGKVLTPNGTFNEFVRKTIADNSDKSNGQIMDAILSGANGREIVVERVPYTAITKDGRRYATSYVNLNFK